MQFKDIKQDYPIYVLDKQEFSLKHGKATAVSFPRLELNTRTGKTEMMVTVTVELDGKTATYVIPESLSVTQADNIVLAVDKSMLTAEVETIKNEAERIVASQAHAKEILDKAPSLLAELSPAFKEKQETETRFKNLEDTMGRLESMMQNFINEFKK